MCRGIWCWRLTSLWAEERNVGNGSFILYNRYVSSVNTLSFIAACFKCISNKTVWFLFFFSPFAAGAFLSSQPALVSGAFFWYYPQKLWFPSCCLLSISCIFMYINLLFIYIQTLKVRIWPGNVVMCTCNPSTPRQRHADLYEFGARLIHTASSRTTRESYTVRPCLNERILKGIWV